MARLQRLFGSTSYGGRASWPFRPHRRVTGISTGTIAIGSSAIGATALGALAFGAVAIGAMAIRRLAVKQARVARLEIDELVVNRVVVRERLDVRFAPSTDGDAGEPDLFEPAATGKANGHHKRDHRMASTLKPGDDAAAGTPGTGEAICPDCSGTGLLNDTTCENCDGTGKVVQGLAGG